MLLPLDLCQPGLDWFYYRHQICVTWWVLPKRARMSWKINTFFTPETWMDVVSLLDSKNAAQPMREMMKTSGADKTDSVWLDRSEAAALFPNRTSYFLSRLLFKLLLGEGELIPDIWKSCVFHRDGINVFAEGVTKAQLAPAFLPSRWFRTRNRVIDAQVYVSDRSRLTGML